MNEYLELCSVLLNVCSLFAGNLTEVPIPTRFLFILLGGKQGNIAETSADRKFVSFSVVKKPI